MKAILTARKMGYDSAVFLEDDVNFDTHPLWKLSLQELASKAPPGRRGDVRSITDFRCYSRS